MRVVNWTISNLLKMLEIAYRMKLMTNYRYCFSLIVQYLMIQVI